MIGAETAVVTDSDWFVATGDVFGATDCAARNAAATGTIWFNVEALSAESSWPCGMPDGMLSISTFGLDQLFLGEQPPQPDEYAMIV